ncbi:hypothetical protein TNCV_1834311 [Trichonephila clavipes]|nr:hypothetical protein TNCV_1834311 [Trichonephila clavipes]
MKNKIWASIDAAKPFAGDKFKSNLMFVDFPVIDSRVQALSRVSSEITHSSGCTVDSATPSLRDNAPVLLKSTPRRRTSYNIWKVFQSTCHFNIEERDEIETVHMSVFTKVVVTKIVSGVGEGTAKHYLTDYDRERAVGRLEAGHSVITVAAAMSVSKSVMSRLKKAAEGGNALR